MSANSSIAIVFHISAIGCHCHLDGYKARIDVLFLSLRTQGSSLGGTTLRFVRNVQYSSINIITPANRTNQRAVTRRLTNVTNRWRLPIAYCYGTSDKLWHRRISTEPCWFSRNLSLFRLQLHHNLQMTHFEPCFCRMYKLIKKFVWEHVIFKSTLDVWLICYSYYIAESKTIS